MNKKLQPGDRFNKFQAKKKPRLIKKDPVAKKFNESLVKIVKSKVTNKKVAVIGLV